MIQCGICYGSVAMKGGGIEGSKKAACLSSVSLVATQAWDLVDDFAQLYSCDGGFTVNQVGSQGGVRLVGNLDIVGVESSSY